MIGASFRNTFNGIMSGMGSKSHQILLWSNDAPETLDPEERMRRIRVILDLVAEKSKHLPANKQNAFIEENYAREVDYGVALLSSLEYSNSTKNLFQHAEVKAMLAYDARYDGRHAATHYSMIRPEDRRATLQEISDLFFQSLGKYVPGLQLPKVELSGEYDDAFGWVFPSIEDIKTRIYGPVFVHEITDRFENDIKTVCHEATHHAMLQMIGLMISGRVIFPEDIKTDLDNKLLQIEHDAYGTPPSRRLYHADPDERLAHRTGSAVQALYVASQNFGSIEKAWEVFKNNEHMIDTYARGQRMAAVPRPI